jgi:hypothetical protein
MIEFHRMVCGEPVRGETSSKNVRRNGASARFSKTGQGSKLGINSLPFWNVLKRPLGLAQIRHMKLVITDNGLSMDSAHPKRPSSLVEGDDMETKHYEMKSRCQDWR